MKSKNKLRSNWLISKENNNIETFGENSRDICLFLRQCIFSKPRNLDYSQVFLIGITPQSKQSVRFSPTGKAYTEPKKREYLNTLTNLLATQKKGLEIDSFERNIVGINVCFNFQKNLKTLSKSKRAVFEKALFEYHQTNIDRDNLLKPFADSLEKAGLIDNDKLFATGYISKIKSIYKSFIAFEFLYLTKGGKNENKNKSNNK